jgi:IS30 family transposase
MSEYYSHLDTNERRQLYLGLEAKKSVSEIARCLGRHRSTIYRELDRNTFYHIDSFNTGYFHMNALYRAAQEPEPAFRRCVVADPGSTDIPAPTFPAEHHL